MRKLLRYLGTILIFTFIWVILNEKADISSILIGGGLSVIAIFFTNYYLLMDDYNRSYSISLYAIIRYLIYLFIQIYKSGIASIGIVFGSDGKVKVVDYESTINDDLALCLLANAITLTPGTVTIDKDNNKLKILQFDLPISSSKKSHRSVLYKFEQILQRREK